MKLLVAITDDELELPIAVAKTQNEMAKLLGINQRTVAYRKKRGTVVEVIIDEAEDE